MAYSLIFTVFLINHTELRVKPSSMVVGNWWYCTDSNLFGHLLSYRVRGHLANYLLLTQLRLLRMQN